MIKPKNYGEENVARFTALAVEAIAQPEPTAYFAQKIEKYPHILAMLSMWIDSMPNGTAPAALISQLAVEISKQDKKSSKPTNSIMKERVLAAETVTYADPLPIDIQVEEIARYWRFAMLHFARDRHDNNSFLIQHMHTAMLHQRNETLTGNAFYILPEVVQKISERDPVKGFLLAQAAYKKAQQIPGASTDLQLRVMQSAFRKVFSYSKDKAVEVASKYIAGQKHPLYKSSREMLQKAGFPVPPSWELVLQARQREYERSQG
jgi:hypothetical protein